MIVAVLLHPSPGRRTWTIINTMLCYPVCKQGAPALFDLAMGVLFVASCATFHDEPGLSSLSSIRCTDTVIEGLNQSRRAVKMWSVQDLPEEDRSRRKRRAAEVWH
jgi:hypothetical protein